MRIAAIADVHGNLIALEAVLNDLRTQAPDLIANLGDLFTAAHLNWIQGLPKTLRLADGDVFACHGSPAGGDLDYLLEDVASGRPVLAPEDAIQPKLEGIGGATLVLCGHTHMVRQAQLGTVLVVNPGQRRNASLQR
jgi:predicted phosphodiesterase